MMTLMDVWNNGTKELKDMGIEEARLDAWYLLEYCFHISKTDYFMNPSAMAGGDGILLYDKLIDQRKHHVPLQYLIGEQEFMGLPFYVDENVLIPRQDTELLVEEVLSYAEGKNVLDLCTGSGCIIISVAKLGRPNKAVGTDISVPALKKAEENGRRNKVEVEWIQSDLFKKVEGKYDIITSNPPYIQTKELKGLMEEVRCHEPILALDGKEDGLYYYRKIIKKAPEFLNVGGAIFLEIGYNQGKEVKKLLEKAGLKKIRVIKDLNGFDRVAEAFME